MKKALTLCLAFVMLATIFTGCGPKETTYTFETVTADEQFERTGIRIVAPQISENAEYLVRVGSDGTAIPEVHFTMNDINWIHRAEKTDKTEDYNFSDLNYEWDDIGSWGYDDVNGHAYVYQEKCGYITWIDTEKGIAYTAFSEACDMMALFDVASELYTENKWAQEEDENPGSHSDEPYVPSEGEVTTTELVGAELLHGVYKYDNAEQYFQFFGNKTYRIFDGDGNTDGKIRFWRIPEDDKETMILYDVDGSEAMSLHVTGTWDNLTVTDQTGAALSSYPGAMNGEYYGYLNSTYLTDNTLTINDVLTIWLSDAVVQELAVGGEIIWSDIDFFAIPVETLEKQSDTAYLINDSMMLTYDSTACAWLLSDHGYQMQEQIGSCTVNDTTEFVDTADDTKHDTLLDCLTANEDGFYAKVTVKDGVAARIEVVELF